MAAVLSPLAVAIFFVLQQVLYPIRLRADDALAPGVETCSPCSRSGMAVGISGMIMTRFGLTAFSFEGKAYWLVKGAPIRHAELGGGKFLAAYIPYLVLGWSLVAVLMLARAISDARLEGGSIAGRRARRFQARPVRVRMLRHGRGGRRLSPSPWPSVRRVRTSTGIPPTRC